MSHYAVQYSRGRIAEQPPTCSLGSSGAVSSGPRVLMEGEAAKPSSSSAADRDLTSSGSAPPLDLNLAVMMRYSHLK